MDRFSILVDAGYLYAAAGELCCATSKRSRLEVDPESVTRFLRERCGNHCDQVHLRTYWYDGARDAVPTEEHLAFGHQQGVKLRLGRLTKNGQKGVDSRIVRDLIVLSRNRAISTVYLVSGDEDVREGVLEAQEFGVAAVLVGIEPKPDQENQAATLIREADDHIILSRSECSKFIKLSTAETKAPRPQVAIDAEVKEGATPTEFGEAYGAAARVALGPETIARALAGHPRVPSTIDVRLIKDGTARFGDPLEQSTRYEIRAGFWTGLRAPSEEAARAEPDEDEPEVESD